MSKQEKSLPKYISIKPSVEKKAQKLCDKLHINFSALVNRLIVEASTKVFGNEDLQNEPTHQSEQEEIDSLA